jgi:AGCS family alanine or glycine:cation symporter
MAARFGVARGLFSNESGMGSAPIAAAAAQSRNPVRQALVSSTGTFWDTVVICAITGLVVVTSVMKAPVALAGLKGAALTKAAFDTLPGIGPVILTVGLLTFVFSTILGWSYYGERCAEYLWGKRAIRPYRIAWVLAVYAGSVLTLQFVWDFSDMANAMMAIPNLLSLLLLSGVIAAETRKYLREGPLDDLAEGG